MKKIVIFALFCLTLCINGNLKAQNCEAILRPYFILNGYSPDEYPQEKAEWRCAFSYSAFYLCDKIPANAKVYSFSELTNNLTKQHPSANYSVDLETLSYYEFDFDRFQKDDMGETVYFRISGQKRYLALRSYYDTRVRSDQPKQSSDKE